MTDPARVSLAITVDYKNNSYTTGAVKLPFSDKKKTSGNSTMSAEMAADRLAGKLFQPGCTCCPGGVSHYPGRSYFVIEGVPRG